MKSRLNLKPGQKGTKALVEQYGKSLLYVRYRYDEVELIVEEKPWQPVQRLRDEDMVPVLVNYTEKALRDKMKASGGKWNPEEKLWYISYGTIRGTDLENRIMMDVNKKKRGP